MSKFSPEEIKQINFSLNTIEYYYDSRHLIYQKVIHNIKDNKDYIKIYYLVFYPHNPSGDSGGISSNDSGPQPIIIKRFTINNLLVKNEKKNIIMKKKKMKMKKKMKCIMMDIMFLIIMKLDLVSCQMRFGHYMNLNVNRMKIWIISN